MNIQALSTFLKISLIFALIWMAVYRAITLLLMHLSHNPSAPPPAGRQRQQGPRRPPAHQAAAAGEPALRERDCRAAGDPVRPGSGARAALRPPRVGVRHHHRELLPLRTAHCAQQVAY